MAKAGVVRVDLKSQLRELLEELDELYNNLNETITKLDFDEINQVLIESFRLMLDKKAPIDVVSDASLSDAHSDNEDDDSDGSGDNSGDDDEPEITVEEREEAKRKQVDKVKAMINSMFGPRY